MFSKQATWFHLPSRTKHLVYMLACACLQTMDDAVGLYYIFVLSVWHLLSNVTSIVLFCYQWIAQEINSSYFHLSEIYSFNRRYVFTWQAHSFHEYS